MKRVFRNAITEPTPLPAYLTVRQAQAYLQVGRHKVLALYHEGKLAGPRLGTGKNCAIRISAASLAAFMESEATK